LLPVPTQRAAENTRSSRHASTGERWLRVAQSSTEDAIRSSTANDADAVVARAMLSSVRHTGQAAVPSETTTMRMR
jgi:hypothetical protein